MKRIVLFALMLTASMSFPTLFAEDAPAVMGGWTSKDFRSQNPAGRYAALEVLPSVTVENGVVLMSFATDMTDLKVSVATPKGVVVYETIVSANGGLTVPVRTGLKSGSYLLLMTHPRIGSMMDKLTVD
ncbi:MAG: DUF3244 domain-containing protein [Tannerellaceae bacterium]|nr:DUF3244 domain-containing protein [Tannerellaceae bacterium]